MSAIYAGKSLESMTKKLKFVTTVGITLYQKSLTVSMRRALWSCIVKEAGNPTRRYSK